MNNTAKINALLWKYYNDYGFTQLWLQTCKRNEEGEPIFSKRIKYEKLLELDDNDYIKEAYCTKKTFLEKASHRSILDIELVIDIDEPKPFNNNEEKARNTVIKLKSRGIKNIKCYKTGSKGYHIHIIFKELALYRHEKGGINKIIDEKQRVLKYLGGDLLKSSHRTGIALEHAKHWKSGKVKEEVSFNG